MCHSSQRLSNKHEVVKTYYFNTGFGQIQNRTLKGFNLENEQKHESEFGNEFDQKTIVIL